MKYFLILSWMILSLGGCKQDVNAGIKGNHNNNNQIIIADQGDVTVNQQPTITETRAESIEFIDLLLIFLVPKYYPANVMLEWSTGANEKSPITWRFKGVQSSPNYYLYMGSMYRKGEVVVTVDEQITHHILEEAKVPGKWYIDLIGDRPGFRHVVISNDRLSQEINNSFWKNQSIEPYIKLIRCNGSVDNSGFGVDIYELSIPGRHTAWMKESWTCGSGGCHVTFVIFYSEEEAEKAGCSFDQFYEN